MYLFTGLGNPGPKYAGNRHNIGFMAVDAIARHHRFSPWRRRFQGAACEGEIAGEKVVALLPETFMNESGRAVAEAQRFYKIDLRDVFAFHDELDLPPAKVRVKRGGGNAGHNGLRSITAHCGNEYGRVRLGIGHPGDKALVHNYVLSDFAKAERDWVGAVCEGCAEFAGLLVAHKLEEFQSRLHLFMEARGFGEPSPVGRSGAKPG
ncbi:aminoacyl-tRNA hydrolase [Ancylobacter sp. G4_0304]|uniref:aminoacyl-tRNA hydrolase n=1 Tax=Ancylobacter sp. G4_0304 TaxID=3114289 RepID=UPI0039C6A3E3